ncbi:hypothetical protein Q4595_13840 [Wenyingzhuangia sp. 1_MG-2023]|nr:hypothetical protein [Wenyingzhuangia sp. 1_MG-2023]
MNLLRKRHYLKSIAFTFFFTLLSCEKEDDSFNGYSIQTNAKEEDLLGSWSIALVENEGIKAEVPATTESCGLDFFIYNENNLYEEYLFQNSETCIPVQSSLNWTLKEGIITMKDSENQESETLKINSLTKDKFVFSVNIDVFDDSKTELFTFTAYKYTPPMEKDIYASSFNRRNDEPFSERLEFEWDIYKGFNTFEKYEIYRSNADCTIENAELIQTITDINTVTFIDENPPVSDSFCYFFKIYTDKGLLGTSNARYVNLEFLTPKNVAFTNAVATDKSVTVNWEKYTGYYFSHYEIKVKEKNSTLHLETVKIIKDINTTSFTDLAPPYLNNPAYTIYVHNIFGNVSTYNWEKNKIDTDFTRPEIFDFKKITFLSVDYEEQSIFFYGQNFENKSRLIKYNYVTKQITAEGFKLPTYQTNVEMKLITSDYGKELIFYQAGNFWVYNASNLTYKYSLNFDSEDYMSVNSFGYLGDNKWIFSDYDNVFTFTRQENVLTKIDQKAHFSDHQGSMLYDVTILSKNDILLSHNNEGRSIHYNINSLGELTNKGIVEIPLLANLNSDISVDYNHSLLLNKKRNTLYNSLDFTLLKNYTNPVVTHNLNRAGTKILGTNNESNVSIYNDNFKKEIVIYDLETNSIATKTTKGYPLMIFEDTMGNLVSLSSGYPQNSYRSPYSTAYFFMEIVE